MLKRHMGLLMIGLLSAGAATVSAEQQPGQAGTLDLTPPDTSYVTRTNKAGNRSNTAGGSATRFEFSRLDTNGNQRISRSEAAESEVLKSRFDEIDRNNDFQITPVEFSAFEVEQMRSQQKRLPDAAAASASEATADRPKRGSWPDPTLAE